MNRPNPAGWYQFRDGKVFVDFYGDTFQCDAGELDGIADYVDWVKNLPEE